MARLIERTQSRGTRVGWLRLPLLVTFVALSAVISSQLVPLEANATPPAPPAAVNPAHAITQPGTPGPTLVTNSISTDTTWGPQGSPYIVTTSISVSFGASLTLLPGTIVKIGGQYTSVVVRGQLLSLGTPDLPVTITSTKDDTIGGDSNGDGTATMPAAGDWYGIHVYGNDSSNYSSGKRNWTVFDYTDLRYGGQGSGIFCSNYGMINITSSSALVTISNSSFAHSEFAGVVAVNPEAGHVGIYGNTFESSRCGVQAWSGGTGQGVLDVVGNVFESSLWDVAIFAQNQDAMRVWFNEIAAPLTVLNSTLTAPTQNEVDVRYNEIRAGIDQMGSATYNKSDYTSNWWGADLNTVVLPNCMTNADANNHVPPITYTTTGCPTGQVHPTGYYHTVTPSLSGSPATLPLAFSRSQAPSFGPVDTFRGVLNYTVEDLTVNDAGQALVAARTYRSNSVTTADAGLGWSLSYTESLLETTDLTRMTMPDGSVIPFAQDPASGYTPAPGVVATLDSSSAGSSIVTPTGTTYQFDPLGELDGLILSDPGHEVDVENVDGKLRQVTGVSGRFLQFDRSGGLVESIVDDQARAVDYVYNTNDQLISVTGVGGETTTYDYADNRLIRVTSDEGVVTLEVGYDAEGRVSWIDQAASGRADIAYGATDRVITLADGTKITQLFDWAGRLVSEQHGVDGPSRHVIYDGEGRVLSVIGGVPAVATNGYSAVAAATLYDRKGDPVVEVAAMGRVTRTSFNAQHKPLVVTYPDGSTVSHAYDTVGRPASVVDQANRTWALQFNSVGQLTSIQDPLARTQTFSFQPDGDPQSETDQLGGVTSFTTDALGRVTSTADPLGRTTAYIYAPSGAVASVTLPGGGVYSVAFDDDHKVVSVEDPSGAVTTYSYDSRGRVASVLNALGDLTSFGYDSVGRASTVETSTGADFIRTYTPQGWPTAETGPGASGETTAYDPSGRPIRVTDALGQVRQTVYNRAGEVVRSQTPDGGQETWAYDVLGRPTSYTSPTSGIWLTAYDPFGNVLNTTNPLGAIESHTYDWVSRITSTTAVNGNVTTYIYDDVNRTVSTSDSIGALGSIEWDAAGQVVEKTSPSGAVTEFEYNADGLLTSEEVAGATLTYAYDDLGNVVARTDPTGNTVATTYDAIGRVLSVTYPGGITESNVYDEAGDLVQVTDAGGNEWLYDYDSSHNLVVATDPEGNPTSYGYDALDRLTTYEDRTGVSWTYAYDPVGRPAVVSDDALNSTVITYDKSGNALTVTDPVGVKITRAYNKLNLPTSQTTTGLSYATSFTYDASGNQLTQTTSSQTAAGTYDLRGRRLTSTDPLSRVTSYTYDAADNLVTETDPAGHATTFAYNSIGRLVETTDPLGNSASYGYDLSGNLTGLELPNGGDYTFAYDAMHRMTSEIDPLGRQTTFAYDPLGNLTSTTMPSGDVVASTWSATGDEITRSAAGETRSYSYDAEGRMLTATTPDSSVEFGYDSRGLLTSSVDEVGETTFAFDTAQRMSQIALPNGDVNNITYNGFGSVATIRGPTNFNYGYDRWANLTARTAVSPTSSSTSQALTYFGDNAAKSVAVGSSNLAQTFTSDGQVATSTNAINGVVNPAEGTTSYAYDAAGRLTSWALSSGGTSIGGEQYTWDADGNRTSVTTAGTTTTATFDAADQLVSTSSGTTFEHSDDGELVAVDSPSGPDASYEYNAFGELVGAVVDGQSIELSRDALGRVVDQTVGGQTTTYGYHGPSNATNAVVSPAGALTGIIRDSTGAAIGAHAGSTTSSILSNLHGDTALYLANSSTPSATALYSPFGTPTTTGTAPTALGFQGMVQSSALDLVDMGARSYDPTAGRFTSRDTVVGDLSNVASVNRYLYGLAAPLDHYDPDGHFAFDFGGFSSFVGKTVAAIVSTVASHVSAFASQAQQAYDEYAPGAMSFAVETTLSFQAAIPKNEQEWLDLGDTVVTGIGDSFVDWGNRLESGDPHAILDVLGFVPVVGEAFDVVNGVLYLTEGDIGNALISFASMVPVAGSVIVGVGRIGLKAADNVVARLDLLTVANRLPTVRPAAATQLAPAIRGGAGPVAQGRMGVESIERSIVASGGTVLGREITLAVPAGLKADGSVNWIRTRPDLYVRLPGGQRVFVEVKTGLTASHTANQQVAFPIIRSGGAVPFGANAVDARLMPGDVLGSIPVWTVHQFWPIP